MILAESIVLDELAQHDRAEWSPFSGPIVEAMADDSAAPVPATPRSPEAGDAIFVWRGSLPWHAHADEVLTGALRHAGIDENEAATLAARFSRRSHGGSSSGRRSRDLIEWSALRDLTSAGLMHTDLWRFRITAIQAEAALNRLITALEREPRYELAVTRRPLAYNMAFRGGSSVGLWDLVGESKAPVSSTLIRSPEMIQTLAAHVERLWADPDTIHRRADVMQLLHERMAALKNRVIL